MDNVKKYLSFYAKMQYSCILISYKMRFIFCFWGILAWGETFEDVIKSLLDEHDELVKSKKWPQTLIHLKYGLVRASVIDS